MKEVTVNGKTYIEASGTYYHYETPESVINILESARFAGNRVRLFYGDTETGRDWNEENDIMGTIGRSTGEIKIPLLIHNSRSMGASGILDHCIVKITVNGITRYEHPTYRCGEFSKHFFQGRWVVYKDGSTQATFDTEARADRYIDFITGKKNRK